MVDALKAAGVRIWVTITDPAEAGRPKHAGADALVVQGLEAGGHRGGRADDKPSDGFGLLALLRLAANDSDRR